MINKTITQAIAERKVLEFYYYGGIRVVEPFVYGIHKETKNEVLCAYQVRGFSRSKKLLRWRLYNVKNMKDIEMLDEPIAPARPLYHQKDKRMTLIYAQVK
mgnify:CR=1 FL=1